MNAPAILIIIAPLGSIPNLSMKPLVPKIVWNAFQTIFGTKGFMERFGIDPSGAIMIRMAGAFMLAVFLMSIYVGFIRPWSYKTYIDWH